MKKLFYALLLCAAFGLGLTSCSKDENEFGNLKEQIIGTWNATEAQFDADGIWWDITKYPNMYMSITFYEDDTYYSSGALGSGGGTYRIKGKTITTYIDGDLIATYEVKSISSGNIEILLTMDGTTMGVRAKKQL